MTKITQGATIVEFKYDGLKRRAQRIAGGVTRDFKYANDQIMVEKEGASIVAEYMLARSLIFREASGAKETYHFDWIGSARALTNAAQTVLATWNYEAFGSVIGATGSSANPYKFDGAWRYRDDGDFGLLHVGARYYEAAVGRWISRDALFGQVDNTQTINHYTYVSNDPVNYVDPAGQWKRPWIVRVVLKGIVVGSVGATTAILGVVDLVVINVGVAVGEALGGPPGAVVGGVVGGGIAIVINSGVMSIMMPAWAGVWGFADQ